MMARKKSKQRQPSLLTTLSDITPNVEDRVRFFRYDLTRLLLSSRIPLSLVNKAMTRDFVDEYIGPANKYLTDRSNLAREYIPAIAGAHNKETFEIFKGKDFSLQVDSTVRMGTWYGFIFRCVTDDLDIVTRPKLKRITRSLKEAKGEGELSGLVIHVIRDMADYYQQRWGGQDGDHNEACRRVRCIAGDRLSVNRCAFMSQEVLGAFPNVLFIDCHPHTLANCRKAMDQACIICDEFWACHNAVFARSEDAKYLWEEHTDVAIKRHNNTRWFAKRDSMEFIRQRWDQYVNFFRLPENLNAQRTSSLAKLRSILCPECWDHNDQGRYEESKQRLFNIRLELAILCEASKCYYAACYNLEGML